jgi:LysM repeat protein
MKNPNPFVPPGSLMEQKNRNRSRFKTAFFCVLAVNIIPITIALLMQGCKKQPVEEVTDTNIIAAPNLTDSTNLPPVDAGMIQSNAMAATSADTTAMPAAAATEYVVVRNDNFTTIAKKFGVTVKAIQDANPTVDPKKLQIGQKLTIPPPTAPMISSGATDPGAGGEMVYVVKSGDTLTKIASDHGTTVRAIRAANNLQSDRIIVGQKLKIPPKTAAPAPAVPQP